MSEDYVSLKVAKILKDKGFDGICQAYYDTHGFSMFNGKGDNYKTRPLSILAPTIQMAMKWLRETHGIHIVIHPSSGVYYGKYCLSIYVQRVKNKDFHLTYQTHEDTYEKAVEEGISYSLMSLI